MKFLKTHKENGEIAGMDLVTVAKFGNAIEAHLARTKLQSKKIESFVFDDQMISIMPTYDIALGGVRLKVRESEASSAAKILGGKSRGSFWAPRRIVFATHLFSWLIFTVIFLIVGLFLYALYRFIF